MSSSEKQVTKTKTSTTTTSQKRSRGFISFLPLGMSCRGRAEAFARRLQFRLRSLNTQDQGAPLDEPEDDDRIETSEIETDRNGVTTDPIKLPSSPAAVNQPPTANGRRENEAAVSGSDEFFDVDLNAGITQHHATSSSQPIPAPRQQSKINGNALGLHQHHNTIVENTTAVFQDTSSDSISLSSSEGTFFDLDVVGDVGILSGADSANDMQSSSLSMDYYDCDDMVDSHTLNCTLTSDATSGASLSSSSSSSSAPAYQQKKSTIVRASRDTDSGSDSGSESLPVSQSTSMSSTATYTGPDDDDDTYNSSTLEVSHQNQTLLELCILSKQSSEKHEHSTEVQLCMKPSAQQTISNRDEEPRLCSTPTYTDELQAGEPVLDEEEVCDTDDDAKMVVNDDSGTAEASHAEAELRPQRLRRCSSLKSGKTPPGTPGRKKFVRFADVFGLDLADVKTFMDEIPTVPRSAYDYLSLSTNDESAISQASEYSRSAQVPIYTPSFLSEKMLTPMFQQPGGMPNFLERVREQNVCLENAIITDPICLTISGTVRVRNLDFHKSVHLRYTLDNWTSYADFQATYVDQSCDGFSDKFTFTIFGNSLRIGQRLEMAVRFSCKGEQFWDSNHGVNYCFNCVPTGTTPPMKDTETLTTKNVSSATQIPVEPVATSANDTDILFY